MTTGNHIKSKKAYLVSLKHKLKRHLQLQSASANQVDRRWLNGFMAAGFHSGLISLSELKLEYMKAYRNAYGERMTEAQEQQLERRLTKLCQMDWCTKNTVRFIWVVPDAQLYSDWSANAKRQAAFATQRVQSWWTTKSAHFEWELTRLWVLKVLLKFSSPRIPLSQL